MKRQFMLFAALLCVFALVSCGSETEYSKFIPKESAVIGRIDVGQIAEKGNLGSNEKLTEIIKKAVKESGLTAKGKVMAEKIISDPKMTGIDLRKPVFYYYNADSKGSHFGIIATVLNDKDLKDFCNYIAKESGGEQTKKYNDVNYVESDDVILAFNNTWLVIKDMENDEANDVINALLAREDMKPEMTIESDAGYQRMLESNGIAQLVIRGGMMAKAMSGTNNRFNIGEAYQDMADFDYIFNLEAENGQLNLDMETFASTEEGRHKLAENKKFYDEISGSYADYIDKNALLSIVANIKGKEIVKFLEKTGMPQEQVDQFKPYLEAINGDVAYTLNTVKANLKGLDMRMFAHLNNPQPYLSLKSELTGVPGINEFANNEFSMSMGQYLPTSELISELGLADDSADPNPGNIMLYFGVNNNSNLYTSFSISSNAFDKVPNPVEKESYHGRFGYVRFNSTAALDIIKLMAKNKGEDDDYEFKLGMHVLGLIDYMELCATTNHNVKLHVVMRDQSKNALDTFFGEIATIVNIFS